MPGFRIDWFYALKKWLRAGIQTVPFSELTTDQVLEGCQTPPTMKF
jgi:hypothetical protein